MMRRRWSQNRWVRAAGALLLLVLIAAAAVPLLAPVDTFRPVLVRLLERSVGRKVEIGALRLHLLPAVSLRASNLRVKNPDGLPAGDAIVVKSIDIVVAPRALLSRRLEVTRIVVDGVRVQMLRGPGGRSNLDTAPSSRLPGAAAQGPPASPRAPYITFDRVATTSIKHIVFTYGAYDARRRQAVTSLTVAGLEARVANLRPSAPDPFGQVEVSADLRGVTISTPALASPVRVQQGDFTFKGRSGRGTATLALEGMRADATFAVTGLDPLVVKFSAVVPEIDIGAIQRVMTGGGLGGPTGEGPAGHRLIARGDIRINRIAVAGLDAQRFAGAVSIYTDTIEFDSYAVEVQGGTARGKARMDYSSPTMPAEATAQIRGVDLARVVKRAAPGARRITGTIDADLRVATALGTDARAALVGNGTFGVRNGVFQGLDLQSHLAQVVRSLQLNVPAGDTKFSYFGGDLRIAGQRVHSEALRLQADTIEGTARGSAGFNRTLDYTGTGVLKRIAGSPGAGPPAPLGQALGGTVQTLGAYGIRVPFSLTGTFDDPKFALAGTPQPIHPPGSTTPQNPLNLFDFLKPKN